MNQLLVFIIGLLSGGVVVWFWVPKRAVGRLQEFNAIREKEREVNKQKILNLLREKGKIANDDVQKLLAVSDATATRYLDELERDGQVRQVGKIGHYVYYEKAS